MVYLLLVNECIPQHMQHYRQRTVQEGQLETVETEAGNGNWKWKTETVKT